MIEKIIKFIGITIEDISKEEAAMQILERKVEFQWRPQIIDAPIRTNVVNFDDLKNKKRRKKSKEVYV